MTRNAQNIPNEESLMHPVREKISALIAARDWPGALAIAKPWSCDPQADLVWLTQQLMTIVKNMPLDEDALHKEASGAAWGVLACIRFQQDRHADSFAYLCRGAAMNHTGTMYWKGWSLECGLGVEADPGEAHRVYLQAARLGCRVCFDKVGLAYEKGSPYNQSFALAAHWFARSKSYHLGRLLDEHPLDCTPFGVWFPDPNLQQFVHPRVSESQKCWMAIASRFDVPKGLALIIASYICSRSGWDL